MQKETASCCAEADMSMHASLETSACPCVQSHRRGLRKEWWPKLLLAICIIAKPFVHVALWSKQLLQSILKNPGFMRAAQHYRSAKFCTVLECTAFRLQAKAVPIS